MAWRKWKIASTLVRLTDKLGEQSVMYDQDVLNRVFQDRYLHIDGKWNVKHVEIKSLEDSCIIHYTSPQKVNHPCSLQLIKYLRHTEYQTFNTHSLAELTFHNIYDKMQKTGEETVI